MCQLALAKLPRQLYDFLSTSELILANLIKAGFVLNHKNTRAKSFDIVLGVLYQVQLTPYHFLSQIGLHMQQWSSASSRIKERIVNFYLEFSRVSSSQIHDSAKFDELNVRFLVHNQKVKYLNVFPKHMPQFCNYWMFKYLMAKKQSQKMKFNWIHILHWWSIC